MKVMVTPRLREVNLLAWMMACRCQTQDEANEYLVANEFAPVVDLMLSKEHIRAQQRELQDVGQYTLDACQGRVRGLKPTKEQERYGTNVEMSVEVDVPMRPGPEPLYPLGPKSYIKDRRTVREGTRESDHGNQAFEDAIENRSYRSVND